MHECVIYAWLCRDMIALNVYIAMCYYKLEYYDVSQEILQGYLKQQPDSFVASNLKACNHFKLFDGKAAETELEAFSQKTSTSYRFGEDLLKHNLVVFRNGEGAIQSLPPLVDVLPEARQNLILYHLKNQDVVAAWELANEMDPASPQEYIIKAVAATEYGIQKESKEHVKIGQQYFQLIGSSPSECDTIPGRQCMASCFFLLRQFEDVLVYLNSVKVFW